MPERRASELARPPETMPPPVDPPPRPAEAAAPPLVDPPRLPEEATAPPEPVPLRRLQRPATVDTMPPPPAAEPQAQAKPDLSAVYAALLEPKPATPRRLVALDAYRGFIMLAMASGGLAIPQVVKALERTAAGQDLLKEQPWWQFLAFHTDHVAWIGCSFWDLIQPAFMFMVGVALPYSFASRLDRGDAPIKIYGHALFRSLLLILLGIFLSSNLAPQTNFTFTNVLTQIGLGYFFLYFFVERSLNLQMLGLLAVLGGYWYWFYQQSLPPVGFDYRTVGVPADSPAILRGVLGHWSKNVNAAAQFDQWFLNLFPQMPRTNPLTKEVMTRFVYNAGGYQTLNFVPSFGTMLLGLMAGELLRSRAYSNREKFVRLVLAGLACFAVGYCASLTICPLIKRIWTPAWTVYSAAFTFWMLAGFFLIIDVWGFRRWSWLLVVVGMNSIAMYCMAQLMTGWVRQTLSTHLGALGYPWVSPEFAPLAEAGGMLLVLWLICAWMYWRKIFIKI